MSQPLQAVDVATAWAGALGYDAPFLIEKLVKERVVDTADAGAVLFTEVKRYLVLTHVDRSRTWKMYSLRVDEAWHQFVLFTVEYAAYCARHFGRYVHHAPSNAPDAGIGPRAAEASFDEFGDRYRELFGVPLPDVWVDANSVALHRRVLNDRARQLRLEADGDSVDLIGRRGAVLFSVNQVALEAMRFIAETGAFYVRELPGDLTDDEKVALVSTLVDMRLLRVG